MGIISQNMFHLHIEITFISIYNRVRLDNLSVYTLLFKDYSIDHTDLHLLIVRCDVPFLLLRTRKLAKKYTLLKNTNEGITYPTFQYFSQNEFESDTLLLLIRNYNYNV